MSGFFTYIFLVQQNILHNRKAFRRCNQANGESAVNDVRIKDIYLTL